MSISIVIPTLQEEAVISRLIHYLRQYLDQASEIIVADGGSTDATCLLAQEAGAIVLKCRNKGRAAQMNEGAGIAKGEILYFLHADTFPHPDFQIRIKEAINQRYKSGCFRLLFNEKHWFLEFNAWFTRFNIDAVRFGDQSLFVKREVFYKVGGFDETHLLLEDQEIIKRLKKEGHFKVLPVAVVTSARKYKQIGVMKLQGCYYLIYILYRLGWSQARLVKLYKSFLG